ncbi:MAG: hypothetical protein ACTHK2_07825 [Dokdonella sp.]|uniref:hypothetical protein n=1 Tax=Dokdonella sp. TaxID=2291710 RepID=UPI003F7E4978
MLAIAIAATCVCDAAYAGNVSLALVSHSYTGAFPNGSAADAAISADGNVVVFSDNAANLVNPPLPSNPGRQIFAYTRSTGSIELISHDALGNPGNAISDAPRVSGDGRYVVFSSYATNLVPGDTNGWTDVFYYDRTLGTMQIVSASASGTLGNANSVGGQDISRDGKTIVFSSNASNLVAGDTNGTADIFVRMLNTPVFMTIASTGASGQANNWSDNPVVSGDGSAVAFRSPASNLVSGATGLVTHAYIHDAFGTTLLNVSPSPMVVGDASVSTGYAINDTGSLVAFPSSATNLVAGDTNAFADAFVRDVPATTTYLASLSSSGAQGNSHVSARLAMSDDGRYLAFNSSANNFYAPDTNGTADIFVRDRTVGTTDLVSQTPAGVQANDSSQKPSMSADGQYIVFISRAGNLDPGASGGNNQVFIAQRW